MKKRLKLIMILALTLVMLTAQAAPVLAYAGEAAAGRAKADPIAVGKEDLTLVTTSVKVNGDPKTLTYNGAEQSYGPITEGTTFSVAFLVGGKEVSRLPEGMSYSLRADISSGEKQMPFDLEKDVLCATNVGEYRVTIYADITGSAEGYTADKPQPGSVVLSIVPRPITVTVTGNTSEVTYDGKQHGVGYTLTASDSSYDTKNVEAWLKANPYINAGTYTFVPEKNIGAFKNNDDNYKVTFVAGDPGTLTITKAPLTITSAGGVKGYNPKALDDFSFSVEKYSAEGLADRDKDLLTVSEFRVVGKDDIQTGKTTFDNTFKYTFANYPTSEVSARDNYVVTEEYGTLEVYNEASEAYVEVSLNDETQAALNQLYDGSEHSVTIDADSFVFGTDSEIYDPKKAGYIGDPIVVKGTDAGEYPIELTASMFQNSDPDFTDVHFILPDAALVISRKGAVVDIFITHEELVYTGEVITVPVFEVGDIEYTRGKGDAEKDAEPGKYDPANIVYNGEPKTLSGKAIGFYTAEFDVDALVNTDKNFNIQFNFIGDLTPTLIIRQPEVIVTINGTLFETTYNGQEQTLEIGTDGTVKLNGVVQDKPAFTLSSDEYDTGKITLRSPVTIKGTDAGFHHQEQWYFYLNGNDQTTNIRYSLEEDIVLKINPKPVTLAIDDIEMTYGDETPSLTAALDGMLGDDEGPKYKLYIDTDHKDPLPVGTYPIKLDDPNAGASPDDPVPVIEGNYVIDTETVKEGKLAVKARPVTVNVTGDRKTVRYTGSEQTFSGWSLSCDDTLYDTASVQEPDSSVCAKGTEVSSYQMGLKAEQFTNTDNNFDVTFKVEDGVLTIASADESIEIGYVTLNGWNGTFDGKAHPAVFSPETVTVGGKEYKIEPNIAYTKDGTPFDGTPLHAGNYTAKVNGTKIIDPDGSDVTAICSYKLPADPVEIVINQKTIRVTIIPEKIVSSVNEAINGRTPRAGYTVTINAQDNLDDENYAFKESDIEYDGQDYLEGEKGTTHYAYDMDSNAVGGALKLTLDPGKFSSSNPDYRGIFTVTGDKTICLCILSGAPAENIGIKLNLKSSDNMVYNGETQVYKPTTSSGQTGLVIVTASNSYNGVNYKNFQITIDLDKLEIRGKDVGQYRLSPAALKNAVVSAYCNDNNSWSMPGYDFSKALTFDSTYCYLTITPKEITVTVNDGIQKNYGDPDPDRSTWVTATGLLPGDNVLDYVSITREPGENVRRDPDDYKTILGYKITVKGGTSGGSGGGPSDEERPADRGGSTGKKSNYQLTNESTGYLYINPLPMTIAADYKEKMLGEPDPVFTYTVDGLIGSEYLAEGFVTIGCEHEEKVGKYPIIVGCDYDIYPERPPEIFIPIDEPIVDPIEKKVAEQARSFRSVPIETASDNPSETRWENEYEYEEWPEQPGIIPVIPGDPIDFTPTEPAPGAGQFHPVNYDITLINDWFVIRDLEKEEPPKDPEEPPKDPSNPPATGYQSYTVLFIALEYLCILVIAAAVISRKRKANR